ncbi:MAG TPA: GGDEF domain-containing protein [Firmicutes bacterium]|nr:GGDEF domain-containing protein [Bacillota bacterium]
MSEQFTLARLEKKLAFFNKMYDIARVVDPVLKQVVEFRGCTIGETDKNCYDYWKSGKICDNCISVRAYHGNRSFIKLEQSPEAIMMVTALPIENAGKPTVLELLKNATDSMMIGSGDYNDGHLMRNMVSEINDMMSKDQLTSLYNRRYVDDRLPVDIIKATIEEWPLSVIFMDIDNLKNINDTHGHAVGDLALKEAGDVILDCIRTDSDWSARYGGDEFLICLNNTSCVEAFYIAERIRNNIAKINIPAQNDNIQFTASLGIHTMQGLNLTAEEIINFADRKMYEAKKSGKNRTTAAPE